MQTLKVFNLRKLWISLLLLVGATAIAVPELVETNGTIEISTVDQLKEFRDAVNSGTTFAGKTVKLTADLDLSGESNWTPIGNLVAYPSQSFNGTFDGNGHSISNVTVNDNTPNHAVAGLFGSVVNGTIKNLTVKNVNLTSTHYAGGIVAYTSNGPTIENCKVIGSTIKSTPEIVNGSYDNGDKIGGIMGYATAGSTINNCTVEGVTITAYRDMGGIVGFSAGTVTNNTAINVTVTQDLTNGYKDPAPTTFGDIIGRDGGATLSNNKVIKGEPVAKIGDEKYYSLADAVAAAQQMGGAVTVELIDDISGETVTIKEVANFKLTIDGKKDGSSNYTVDAVIVVDGLRGNGGSTTNGASVTLQNIAFVKTTSTDGIQASHYPHHLTIQNCTYSGFDNDKWFLNASVDGPLYGVTVKNVTVEHARLIYANMAEDAVFQNITATTDCKVGFNVKTSGTALIDNCHVTTGKYAFRDYSDGYAGTFTLKDNTFISTSEDSTEGAIVNRGGAEGTAHINVESGTYIGALTVLNNKKNVLVISGGQFSAPVGDAEYAGYFAEGLCGVNGLYEGDAPNGVGTAVASITAGETTIKFATFEAAVDAATSGETIELLANITDAYTMSEGQTLKVKKNGVSVTIKAPEGYVLKSSTTDGVTTYTIAEADYMFTNEKTGAVTYYQISSLGSLNTGGTFKLLKDVTRTTRTVSSAMAGGTKIIFDLNGHTLTYTSTDASFLLSGIYGSESSLKFIEIVDNSDTGGGKLVMNGEIEITGRYYDVTIGKGVTIEGKSILIDSKYYNKLTVEGTINGGNEFAVVTNGNAENANITIKDGAVLTSAGTAMYLPGTGTTTIEEGAKITGSTGIYIKSATLNIEGGEITGNGEKKDYEYWNNGCHSTGQALVVDNCNYPGGAPNVNITGGKFTTANNESAIGSYAHGDGAEPLGEFVHGGYFSTELPREICEAGKRTVPSTTVEGYYELGEVVFVAQIGDTKYESLAAAVAEVPADGTETSITMIANEMINVTGYAVTIPATKNIILDLNGYQVVGTVEQEGTSALIRNLGTLTIKDSSDTNKDGSGTGKLMSGASPTWTWDGSDDYSGSYASNLIRNEKNLIVESGYLYNMSTGSAAYAIDNYSAGNVTINGGKVDAAKASAIRMFYVNGGSITVNDGIIGHYNSDDDCTYCGIQVMSGGNVNVSVNGGTIVGNYAVYSNNTGGNINISGGTYDGYVGFAASVPNIEITGGAFNYWVGTWGDQTKFISGGIYAEEVDEEYIADGYILVDNTNPETKDAYPYAVRQAYYICAIGTTKYETLADAVAAAGTAETTITLLTEAATDGVISGDGVKVPSGSNITFDLNGLTYNASGETVGSSTTETQGFQLLKNSNITIKNGTLKATSPTAQMVIQNYSNLTLEDVNLDGTTLSGDAYALSNNCGTINLTGSTSITAKSGGRAFDTCKFGSYAIPTVNINTTGVISGPIEATGGKLNIENGKFDVTWVTDSHYAAGDIQIKGGVFSTKPAEEYCAEGYVATDNEDEATKDVYPYTVMSKEDAGIFELLDWEPYPYKDDTADRNATSITYKRKFPSNNYNAWYVPFDYNITEEDLQNFDFYKFHMISASSSTGNANVNNVTAAYIHLQKITTPGTKLRGNSPYVIQLKNTVDETAVYEFKMEGDNLKLLKPNNNSAFQMMSADFDYDFFGTYAKYGSTKDNEWFALNSGKLSPNKKGASINQYRWVLKLTPRGENSDYSKISFGFIEDEDATGLSTIGADEDNQIEGIYSVNGSKHDNLEKGINIIRYKNGTTKKVIIK